MSKYALVLAFLLALPAFAGTTVESLHSPLTVQPTYTLALNSSVGNSGSVFVAVVGVLHPSQSSLRPRLWVDGKLVALTASSRGDNGELRWMYSDSNAHGSKIGGKLELRSTAGAIQITPSNTQQVYLQLYSCSTIPFAGGC